MSKFAPDSTIDAFLDTIADNCTRVVVCSTQPTNYTEANATYALADVTVTAGVGNGDFTRDDGDTSGRKIILAQQTAIPVDTTGTAAHIALLDVSNTTLLAVTTFTPQEATSGNSITMNAFDIEVLDVA